MRTRDSPPTSSPAVRRLRSAIVDPRLLVGALLVGGSVAGVVGLVSAADETVEVYAATGPLSPGDRVTSRDLGVVEVRLAEASDLYLVPGDIPDAGAVVTRPVARGELVPASAVGSIESIRLAPVVVSVTGALPASVAAGTAVDLWAADEEEPGTFATPTVLVPAAIVVRLVSTETIVAGGEVTAIEVLVPHAVVARVLEALANDAAVSVVPTSLPLGE